jgi:branched-chain amino acid transport system permease protein
LQQKDKTMHRQNGFTLIEIAIVLVIIGLLLGALESLASFYIGSGWREAPGLLLLILALAMKPNGVFGKATIRKV